MYLGELSWGTTYKKPITVTNTPFVLCFIDIDIYVINSALATNILNQSGPIFERESTWGSDVWWKSALFEKKS